MVCFFVMYIWIMKQPNAKKDQIFNPFTLKALK